MGSMSKGRKTIYWILTLIFILSLNATAFAQDGGGFTPVPSGLEFESIYSLESKKAPAPASDNGLVGVIVKLNVDSVTAYKGGIAGLAPTSPRVTGKNRLDLNGQAEQQYLNFVRQRLSNFEGALRSRIATAVVTHRYDIVLGGVSLVLPASQLPNLANLPDVIAVYPDELRQMETDRSPEFIGAPTIWNQLGGQESAGEGVVVGILDSGVWPEHPSFSDPDPSGKPYAEPPATYTGTECNFGSAIPGDDDFTCNNKLIGAYRFMDTYEQVNDLLPNEFRSARDDDGHGTHTATTSAGNAGVEASIFGVNYGTISGIAPRAQVVAYKVCGVEGCYTSDSAAAVQQAIADGVNVINFSISGGGNPYSDMVELAFLDAYEAGLFVAASAGNAGPGLDTTDHRGPWVTTVAASTSDRAFKNSVTLTSSDGAELTVTGDSITGGIADPTPVVTSTDTLCLAPIPAAVAQGKIVACQRGSNARVEKGYNVMQGGGVGMILYNPPTITDVETDNHFIPTSHMNWNEGSQVLDFLASHPNVMGTMTAGSPSEAAGDVLATFSSRGGPGQVLGVNKPDITAPGVQILAGASPQHVELASGPQGELFQAIAGTSMSSPHIAGSAALLKALHPDWSPSQIKSALMTSAKETVVKDDGVTPATPFEVGAGRVDLNNAGSVGLTFNETADGYRTLETELWKANYPSLYVPIMPGKITVQRRVHSELDTSSVWKLSSESPADVKVTTVNKITVGPHGETGFNITVDASTVPLGEVRHATLYLEHDGQRLHFPITIVRREADVALATSCEPSVFPLGDTTDCSITMTNNTFSPADVVLTDQLPRNLRFVPGSVNGAQQLILRRLKFTGTLAPAEPPDVAIAEDPNAMEYLPLSAFGITPIAGVGDETIVNYNVPAYEYAGETYTRLGVVSNGYLVVGGGTGADVEYLNQNLPDATPPNNVLAPFWTDLNPGAGGAIRIGILSDNSGNDWLVVDYAAVKEYSTATNNTFQVWIGLNGVEDISYAYGAVNGNGDGGLLTVGAENMFGNRGENYYYDGTGTLPTATTLLRVTGTAAGAGETKVITFSAKGVRVGTWLNCARLTSNVFFGTSVACASGEVTQAEPNVTSLAEGIEDFELYVPFITGSSQ